jgi:hypothetical protein
MRASALTSSESSEHSGVILAGRSAVSLTYMDTENPEAIRQGVFQNIVESFSDQDKTPVVKERGSIRLAVAFIARPWTTHLWRRADEIRNW